MSKAYRTKTFLSQFVVSPRIRCRFIRKRLFRSTSTSSKRPRNGNSELPLTKRRWSAKPRREEIPEKSLNKNPDEKRHSLTYSFVSILVSHLIVPAFL